jgi:hypothetical protein
MRGIRSGFGVVLIVSAAVAGCQSTVVVEQAFDAKAAEYVLKAGTGRIEGQAFMRRDYGRLVTAAGERVFLLPATSYVVERFDRMFGGDRRAYFGASVENTPPDYYRYRRETKVDMNGRFQFENLSPGRYLLATRVFWTEPKSYFTHGGAVYDIVDVKADEATTAIISGK